jgi:hypothetical protein
LFFQHTRVSLMMPEKAAAHGRKKGGKGRNDGTSILRSKDRPAF